MNTDERIEWFDQTVHKIFPTAEFGLLHLSLLKQLERTDYFTAPASTNKHHAYEGGLFDHSRHVYETLVSFREIFTEREAFVIGMFHDLCKLGQYKPNILKSGNISEAKPWLVEDDLPLGHGSKSVYVASKLLELSERETLGIFWHMGPFDKNFWGNEGYLEKVFPEWRLVHAADLIASYERRETHE